MNFNAPPPPPPWLRVCEARSYDCTSAAMVSQKCGSTSAIKTSPARLIAESFIAVTRMRSANGAELFVYLPLTRAERVSSLSPFDFPSTMTRFFEQFEKLRAANPTCRLFIYLTNRSRTNTRPVKANANFRCIVELRHERRTYLAIFNVH